MARLQSDFRTVSKFPCDCSEFSVDHCSTEQGERRSAAVGSVSYNPHLDSEVLVGPVGVQGLISPHVLQYNPKNSTFTHLPLKRFLSPEYKLQQQSFLKTSVTGNRGNSSVAFEPNVDTREDVKMHRLLTESLAMKVNRSCTIIEEDEVDLFTMQLEKESPSPEHTHNVYASPSPEPYVICTSKGRSETSCSSESQGSSTSSNEEDVTPHASPAAENFHRWPQGGRDLIGRGISTSPRQESLEKRRKGKVWCDSLPLTNVGSTSPKSIRRTRPVPPPKHRESIDSCEDSSPLSSSPWSSAVSPASSSTLSSPLSSPLSSSYRKFLSSRSVSNSELGTSLGSQCSRAFTFHDCKAGEESGKFTVDYLGSKEADIYIKSINSITKQLMMEHRPKEMVVYVSSEKIRLAPPNSATLYKSFAIKDVLWVRKCSKYKHIVGIVLWKARVLEPCCHILRCRDNIMAKTLFDTLWDQTQKVDDIGTPPSKDSNSSSHVPRSCSITSMSSEEGDSISSSLASPISITEVLHRFPSIYIGSAAVSKSYCLDKMISKVLLENKPSDAKSVMVTLRLPEVQLSTSKRSKSLGNDDEVGMVLSLSHETSRIRAMGVFTDDRRFAGYIIKEVGKPLEGHVIRCNSAALMTSFASFLRQSCQLTSPQRGGSFYDELSTDESDEWEHSFENSACSSSLVGKIKSLTSSISQFSSLPSSPTISLAMPYPTFQCHMHPLENAVAQSSSSMASSSGNNFYNDKFTTGSPVLSSLDFSEDEYAKYRVTYMGSATHDYPLSQHSIQDALDQFTAKGTAVGQATFSKNTIHLQVSSLGINLTDKTRKMFVHRNYPSKTVVGFCQHYNGGKHFAFATNRPGFPNVKKVHVFCCGVEPVEQILAAMKYWLQLDPIVSLPLASKYTELS